MDAWITTIDRYISETSSTFYINPKYYQADYDLDDIFSSKIYTQHVFEGLESGFHIQEINSVSITFYITCRYTPDNLRSINNDYGYKVINNVLKIFSLRTLRIPSFEKFSEVLRLGFVSDKEFKTFVNNFDLSYGDPELFTQIIQLGKQLSDEDVKIVKNPTATIKDVAKVLVKLP